MPRSHGSTVPRNRSELLVRRIDSMQAGFKKLSGASSLKHLSSLFIGLLRPSTRGFTIDMFHRRSGSALWEPLTPRAAAESVQPPTNAIRKREFVYELIHTANGTTVLQRLIDGSFLAIVISRRTKGRKLSAESLLAIRLLSQLFDNAYHDLLHRLNQKSLVFSLNHRVLQLNSLIDTGIEVSRLGQDSFPHQLALERAASLTNASRGRVKVSQGDAIVEEIAFPEHSDAPRGGEERQMILSQFVFGALTYTFELFDKESRSGIIPFEDTDQMLLDALARQVYASLENRFLLAEELEKQKFEQDMGVAAAIQKKIIPASLPTINGYDLAGINIPSKSVGGDYYDCIPLSDGRYAFIIADVAGKGVPAALLVSSLHAYLGAYLESQTPLGALTERLNKVIWRASTDDKFITAFFAVLTPGTGEMELMNAGHNPAYLMRSDGTVVEFAAAGLPLGMLDMELPYASERITIGKGDRFLLYTDGIPEATDEEEEFYDTHRPLLDFFTKNKPERSGQFIAALIADLKGFTGNAPQSDDITALYLQRTA